MDEQKLIDGMFLRFGGKMAPRRKGLRAFGSEMHGDDGGHDGGAPADACLDSGAMQEPV